MTVSGRRRRLVEAIEGNVAWYCAVMDAHGLPYERAEAWWATNERVPPYYSSFLARAPERVEEQLSRIASIAKDPPSGPWSVADGLGVLPGDRLQTLGFSLLFEAPWFGGVVAPSACMETQLRFMRVDAAAELAAWEQRWKAWSPSAGVRVFPDRLLEHEGVLFWDIRHRGRDVGGAITHLDGRVVSLSNVFMEGRAGQGAYLRDAARCAGRLAEGRMVVGYGAPTDLHALGAVGFEALGMHRVWVADDSA